MWWMERALQSSQMGSDAFNLYKSQVLTQIIVSRVNDVHYSQTKPGLYIHHAQDSSSQILIESLS